MRNRRRIRVVRHLQTSHFTSSQKNILQTDPVATRAVTSHPVKPELYQNVYTDTGTLMKNDVRNPYYEAGLVAFRGNPVLRLCFTCYTFTSYCCKPNDAVLRLEKTFINPVNSMGNNVLLHKRSPDSDGRIMTAV